MPEEPTNYAGVISDEEFERGKGVWPCVKCGRLENESCNGMGIGVYCPNGRTRPEILSAADRAACKMRPDWNPYPLSKSLYA